MVNLKEVEHWFAKAHELAESHRKAYLLKHLGDKPALLEAVNDLLESEEAYDHVLTRIKDQANNILNPSEEETEPQIPRFRIQKLLGSGGLASVYLAARADGVFDQHVAVKVLKRKMSADDLVARFTLERNVLAQLKHPNISQILDGGLTNDGRPYFVMEWVEGVDINAYCESNELTHEDRLRLFKDVCKAVAFAHQHLIIHADIKPGNVLVTADGQVKLTDFGVAQLLNEKAEGKSNEKKRTLLTPAFASPEQLNDDPIDTRSDIFQLGRLLETLVGRVGADFELKQLITQATAINKEERFISVNALSAEVDRYLNNEPLSAFDDRLTYRFKKYIQRNRLLVLLTLIGFLVFTTGAILYVSNMKEANEEILYERNVAKSSANFLLAIYQQAYPAYSRGDTLTVFDLFAVADSIIEKNKDQNDAFEIYGRFHLLQSQIYASYKLDSLRAYHLNQAMSYLGKAAVIDESILNSIFTAQIDLIDLLTEQGKLDAAEAQLELISTYLANLDPSKADSYVPFGQYFSRLAWVRAGQRAFHQADSLFILSLDAYLNEIDKNKNSRKKYADTYYLNQLTAYGRYINRYFSAERATEIDSIIAQSDSIFRKKGLDSTRTNDYADFLNFAGQFYMNSGKLEKASDFFNNSMAINKQLYGENNINTLNNINNLAIINYKRGNLKAAQAAFLECAKMAKKLSFSLSDQLVYAQNYAAVFNKLEQYDEAIFALDSLLSLRKRALPQQVFAINAIRKQLGDAYAGKRQYVQAAKAYKEVIASHRQNFGSSGTLDLIAAIELIKTYQEMRETAKAKQLANETDRFIRKRLGDKSTLLQQLEEARIL